MRTNESNGKYVGVGDPNNPNKNPFQKSVDEMIHLLRLAVAEERWRVPEKQLETLQHAPAFPTGHLEFLSPYIRFGERRSGVIRTFEAHIKRIKTVYGKNNVWRWSKVRSGQRKYGGRKVDSLRLLDGNHTHKPSVGWCTFNLNAHRERESVEAVRSPQSLADQALVFTWMYPEYIYAMDFENYPAIITAGYQLNVPEYSRQPWQNIPSIFAWRKSQRPQIHIAVGWYSNVQPKYAIPSRL